MFTSNRGFRFADVTDGTTNTLLIGERGQGDNPAFGLWFGGCGQSDYGLPDGDEQRGSADVILGVRELNSRQNGYPDLDACPPGPYHYGPAGQIKDAKGNVMSACDQFHFWSMHTGGANFAITDGSVRFIPYSADNVLPALSTRGGGEVISSDSY